MFSNEIKAFRKRHGLTQEQLGELMGYHRSHIERLELGHYKSSRRARLEFERIQSFYEEIYEKDLRFRKNRT